MEIKMKKIFTTILVLLFTTVCFSQTPTLYVHKKAGGYDQYKIADIDSITFSLSTNNPASIPLEFLTWKCHTEYPSVRQYLVPAIGVYEKTAEGLKIFGPEYRGNKKIHPVPVSSYPIIGKTVYMKWKANGGGGFMGVGPFIVTDTTAMTAPSAQMTNFTTSYSYAGSYLITNDMWYYSRMVINTTSFSVTTATGNYDNQGGTLVQTQTGTLTPIYNVLMFGIWDTYSSTAAYAILGEARIE